MKEVCAVNVSMDEDVRTFLNSRLGRDIKDAYKKCSNSAYLDMCRTIRFHDRLKELKCKPKTLIYSIKNEKKKLSDSVAILIERQVEAWLSGVYIDQKIFDKNHKSLCEAIIKVYKDTTEQKNISGTPHSLSYGQAQKWVNMSLKNLYIYDDSNSAGMGMHKLLPFMHIPIDNVVLDIVTDKRACYIDSPSVGYGLKKNSSSWSRWSEKEYLGFRKLLNDRIDALFPGENPIRWELKHWSTVEQ